MFKYTGLFVISCIASTVHRIYGEDFTTRGNTVITTLSDSTPRNTKVENTAAQGQKKSKAVEKNDMPNVASIPGSSSTSPSSAKTPKLTLIFKKSENAKLSDKSGDIQPAALKSWKSLDVDDMGFERRKSALSDIDSDVQATSKDKTTQSLDKPDLKHLIHKMVKEPPQIPERPPSMKKFVSKMEMEQTNDASSKSGRHQTSDQQALNALNVDAKEQGNKSLKNVTKPYFPYRTKLKKSSV